MVRRVNQGSGKERCVVEVGVMVKKEKKKGVPWRRVVSRIGSVVEREARDGGEADEARGDTACE